MSDYVSINLANWDSRVPVHLKGYALDRFRTDPSFLSGVVRYDLPRLGSVKGLRVAHLQCHIGTDTLSLERLGAYVVGLDFSPAAIAAARALAHELGQHATFVESDVYRAGEVLPAASFDLVYTGIGAICWLPDIARWAKVVASLLKPGGRLFIRDGHPMLFALGDARPDGLLTVEYPYFEHQGVTSNESTSYEGDGEALTSPASVSFNHGIGEMLAAVKGAGMDLREFTEHDTAPWNPLDEACEQVGETGEWRLRGRPGHLPMTFTLVATKPM
ncbi:MAG: class I SAM-dependent methyltransferase [Planctomycetota bacterium]|nr:class I SAM-dependent methyltransferase [Planctomycetota bacterium]